MYLKLMSCDPAPDHAPRKRFRILSDVAAVGFERVSTGLPEGGSFPQARVTFRDGTTEYFGMVGNAYVMTDDGKTISSFAYEHIPGSSCAPVAEQEALYGNTEAHQG